MIFHVVLFVTNDYVFIDNSVPFFEYYCVPFSSTLLRKLSDDIERALEEGRDGSSSERIVRAAAKRIASVAKQGVEGIKS